MTEMCTVADANDPGRISDMAAGAHEGHIEPVSAAGVVLPWVAEEQSVRPQDGSGGACISSEAHALRVVDPGSILRCIDLVDSPNLVALDLSPLEQDLHLSVRGCPALQVIRLPASHAAHVHWDAGIALSSLRIEGGVEQFDASWAGAQAGCTLQRTTGRPWPGVMVHAGCGPASPAAAGGLLIRAPGGSPYLVVSPDTAAAEVVVCAADAVRQITCRARLARLSVEGARALRELALTAAVDRLEVTDCARLRRVGSVHPCGRVVVRRSGGGTPVSRQRPADPSARAAFTLLAISARCEELSLIDLQSSGLHVVERCKVVQLIRCSGLRRIRAPEGTVLQCEGHVPARGVDRLRVSLMAVDETLQRVLLDRAVAVAAARACLDRVLDSCGGKRGRSVALAVLAGIAARGGGSDALWRMRCRVFEAQLGSAARDRWIWHLPRDLATKAYRDDFRIYEACSGLAATCAFPGAVVAELVRARDATAAEALLPWLLVGLASSGAPARQQCLKALFESAERSRTVSATVCDGLARGLPALVGYLRSCPSTGTAPPDGGLLVSARRYFLGRHPSPMTTLEWLRFDMRVDRASAQAWIARALAAPTGRWRSSDGARAALIALMFPQSPRGTTDDDSRASVVNVRSTPFANGFQGLVDESHS